MDAPATELAAASHRPPPASLDIVVTSPEGVDSPGLDAAASVLLGRPDVATSIVAPAADVTGAGASRSTSALAPVDGRTMTGLPARVVNGTVADALATVLDARDRPMPDLVVVGFTSGATIGPPPGESAAFAAARLASDRGIPAIVVEVGGEEPDLAAAGLLLATVLDFDLDTVLAEAAVRSLTVPSCEAGMVRGPVVVDASDDPAPAPEPDCTELDHGPIDDDVAAHANGFAALVER